MVPKLVLLFVALWFILQGDLCLTLFYLVLAFISPFNILITLIGEERANLSAFRTFVRFSLVWFCLFSLLFGVWEGLWFVTVPASILRKSTSGRHRPVSYPDGPMTARYRFM